MNNTKLNKIRIQNYQSIGDLELELGAVTVIQGKSRCGKSAFYRAVKGAVENQTGEAFTTIGENETRVDLDDVAWIQSKKRNDYIIAGNKSHRPNEFQKCGREVPEPVQDELGMAEIEFGKDLKRNLNFVDQLGEIFLVQGKGSDNAKIIGSISNVNIIYNALREAERISKDTMKGINLADAKAEDLQERLATMEEKVALLDEIHDTVERIFKEAKATDLLVRALVRIREELRETGGKIYRSMQIKEKYGALDLDVDLDRLGRLISAREALRSTRSEKDRLEGLLGGYFGIDLNIEPEIDRIQRLRDIRSGIFKVKDEIKLHERLSDRIRGDLLDRGEQEAERVEALKKALSGLKEIWKQSDSTIERIQDAEEELALSLKDLESFDECEVCGSPRSAWKMEEVL